MFKKGFRFKHAGLVYEKQDDDDFGLWLCLNCTCIVSRLEGKDKIYETAPQDQLPKSMWYGFKWTDEQIRSYFNIK